LHYLKATLTDETDEKAVTQHYSLTAAYKKLYTLYSVNPQDLGPCDRFYNYLVPRHECLLAMDSSLFVEGILASIYDEPEIDSLWLYEKLTGGKQDTGEYLKESDGKLNLWNTLISLYRISVVICIYLKVPLIRDIISLIFASSTNMDHNNLFQNIMTQFKSKAALRKLIMRLLKSEEHDFEEIFTNLQRVVATFAADNGSKHNSSEVGQSLSQMMGAISSGSEEKVKDILQQHGMSDYNINVEELQKAMEAEE
jgi:hypothetical protein